MKLNLKDVTIKDINTLAESIMELANERSCGIRDKPTPRAYRDFITANATNLLGEVVLAIQEEGDPIECLAKISGVFDMMFQMGAYLVMTRPQLIEYEEVDA